MKDLKVSSIRFSRKAMLSVINWFDSKANDQTQSMHSGPNRINWVRCLPFIFVHVCCFGAIFTGVSTTALAFCLIFFWLRMFSITAFYHRYFSHKSFKTGRFTQFLFAVMGNSSCQRGPLWWASHHRRHHKHSDQDEDLHSPISNGFWFSHIGWFMSDYGFKTDYSVIKDLVKYPELRFLDRFDTLVPILFAVATYFIGEFIGTYWPQSETSGLQMLVWGFFVSTTLLFHATFTINSLGHIWGKRRFNTKDQSRNNFWLALLTLGEGWHNNHHRFAVSARQGFYWWEIDVSYYLLKILSFFCVIYDLNPVPLRILKEGSKNG